MIKKTLSIALLTVLCISFIGYGQAKPDSTPKPFNDSLKILSVDDIKAFNEVLEKSIPYSQYKTLTPESTLAFLINWGKLEYMKPKQPKSAKGN